MGDQSDPIKIKNEEGTVFGFCSLRIESSYPLHNDNAKQRGDLRPRCFAMKKGRCVIGLFVLNCFTWYHDVEEIFVFFDVAVQMLADLEGCAKLAILP